MAGGKLTEARRADEAFIGFCFFRLSGIGKSIPNRDAPLYTDMVNNSMEKLLYLTAWDIFFMDF